MIDLNKDDRVDNATDAWSPGEAGTLGPPEVTGSALSLALRLRNRKSGTSHTQIAKNVATSENPGGGI